jgi:putative toxin-antitoxin system antitoxin component (TIGR02293 family)
MKKVMQKSNKKKIRIAHKAPFRRKMNELKRNKKAIYINLDKQAAEKETRAFYEDPRKNFGDLSLDIDELRTSLKKSNLVFIAKKFKLTNKQAAAIAGISVRTYHRWKPNHLLSVPASSHLLKVAEVYNSGIILFDNDHRSFTIWMKAAVPAMANKVPVDMMTSSIDEAELVNAQLIRMEYGIFA